MNRLVTTQVRITRRATEQAWNAAGGEPLTPPCSLSTRDSQLRCDSGLGLAVETSQNDPSSEHEVMTYRPSATPRSRTSRTDVASPSASSTEEPDSRLGRPLDRLGDFRRQRTAALRLHVPGARRRYGRRRRGECWSRTPPPCWTSTQRGYFVVSRSLRGRLALACRTCRLSRFEAAALSGLA